MEAASAQQLAAQQAGAAIHPLSERITAAPVAAVGSLDGDPQNSLQRARLDSTGQSDRAEAGAAAAGALAQPSIVAAAGVRAGGGNGSSTAGSGGGGAKPALFLFIGILSGRGYRHRRLAVREAWSRQAQMPNISAARFILSADEHNAHVQSEIEDNGDIVFVAEATNYKSILFKTYFLFEYAVTTYDVAFILKTDDDSFVNPPWLVIALRQECVSVGCRRERLYMGRMATASPVLLRPGHRWANADFWNHTGLRRYPKYAMGGGYVLSGDAASMLVDMQARVGLKFSPIEDAMMGTWLMPLDLRHVSHRRFWTWANPCCFRPPARREVGAESAPRFEFTPKMPRWICSDNPWLVLHKVDSPAKMRFLGEEFAKCSPPPAVVLCGNGTAVAGTA